MVRLRVTNSPPSVRLLATDIDGTGTAFGQQRYYFLNAGVAGVKAVDAKILISLHIDRGNSFSASKNWIDNATTQKVAFDAFGESCYQTYQGDPNSTANTRNMTKTMPTRRCLPTFGMPLRPAPPG